MKVKGMLIVMSLLLTSLSFGCFDNSQKYPTVMPDDFYFISEKGFSPSTLNTLLDTKQGIIGKLLGTGADGYISTKYNIPQENLQGIYDLIVQYDIKSYSGSEWLTDNSVFMMNLEYYSKLTFCIDGKIYTVLYGNSVTYGGSSRKYANLGVFERKLHSQYCVSTEEYQSFPEATNLPE